MTTERQYPLETVMDRNEVIAQLNTNRKLRKAEQVADEEGETRMKSKYHTIIKAILKSEGLDAEPGEVEDAVRKEFKGPLGSMCVSVFIDACKFEGLRWWARMLYVEEGK